MKSFSASLFFSALVVLFACSAGVDSNISATGNGLANSHSPSLRLPGSGPLVTLNLAGLRPDLEYLRGYWLKNPREYHRQGRIIFSNTHEIVVTFGPSPQFRERCPSSSLVDQWTTESLHLKNIDHLSSNTSILLFTDLLYNHGTFYRYSHENSCDLPEVVEEDQVDLKISPIMMQNDEKKSIQVLYTDLKTLGYDIEREVSKIDLKSKSRMGLKVRRRKPERRSGEGLFINSAESEFTVEYENGSRYVNVPHVRVLESSVNGGGGGSAPIEVDFMPPSLLREQREQELEEHHVSFLISTDYPLIRYDRVTKSFYTPGNELLEDHWFVRSFLGDYVLKDQVKSRSVILSRTQISYSSVPSRPRISYSKVARATIRALAPIVKGGALGMMYAMFGAPLNLNYNIKQHFNPDFN